MHRSDEYVSACPTTLAQLDENCHEVELVIEDGRIVRDKPRAKPLRDTSIATFIVPAGSVVRLER